MLSDYLRVLRRRKWLFLPAALLVSVAAVLLSLRQENLYEASAEVLLRQEDLAATLTGTAPVYQDPIRLTETQANLARVPAVAQRVLRQAGLSGRSVEEFLDASRVGMRPNADLLEFFVTDRNPRLAAKLASAYARQFTIYHHRLDTAAIVRARDAVAARVRRLEAQRRRRSPLYATLVAKEQQLRTIEALKTSNASVVRVAHSAEKVQPRPLRNGVLGLALGLVIGAGLVFLAEALDTRVRSADEVAERLGLPLLGRLPAPPRRLRKSEQLVTLVQPNSHEAEPFRILRTNLEFANLDRGSRTIMVTSAVEEEGKSTTLANLAVSLARAGRHVILVDLDLRRPFLHHFFGIEAQPGLTDVALGHASIAKALATVPLGAHGGGASPLDNGTRPEGSLRVLAAGLTPPDPGEFVAGRATSAILEQLTADCDVVLVDSPPILYVGDAMTLSAKVDAVLVVVKMKVVTRPMLKELDRVLTSCGAERLGFVLAGAHAEEIDAYAYGYMSYHADDRPSPSRERERFA